MRDFARVSAVAALILTISLGLAACGGVTAHNASARHRASAAPAATATPRTFYTAGYPQSTTTPNCPRVNRVLDSVFDGSYAGLPPAKTTQDLISNFLGQTTGAVNAMEPVMTSLNETPGGKGPRGMPQKLLQAEANLYVVVGLMANEQAGDWTQQNINSLSSSLTTIDQICATPSTPWAQQFEQGLQ
jgi:hypothetical protein